MYSYEIMDDDIVYEYIHIYTYLGHRKSNLTPDLGNG